MLEIVLGPTTSRRRPIVLADTPGSNAADVARALTASASSCTRLLFASPQYTAALHVIRGWYRDLWNFFPASDRRRVMLVAGDTAQYLAPLLGEGTRVLAFIADPVEVSLGLGLKPQVLTQLEKHEQHIARRVRMLLNPQSRALLGPWHDSDIPVTKGPPPDGDEWRAALQDVLKHVSAVPAEAAADEASKIAAGFRWFDKIVGRYLESATPARTRKLSDATRKQIGQFCWLDAELYAAVTEGRASR